jgi:hypothetical protein
MPEQQTPVYLLLFRAGVGLSLEISTALMIEVTGGPQRKPALQMPAGVELSILVAR